MHSLNIYINQFVPWLAKWLCIDFGGIEECPDRILIDYNNLKGLKFRNVFLKQFLPWLLVSDFDASCLEMIGNQAGKPYKCRRFREFM